MTDKTWKKGKTKMDIIASRTGKRTFWYRALVLLLLSAFFCWLFCLRQGAFGSKVDWISQHSVLPDYFRRQFYATGNLFPEFAANIGGGQNIYHFSYYGLYSPVILLSYLLPFVKMSDYIMGAQFVCLAVSVILVYLWLRNQKFGERICFGTAVLFLLAAPMIFHSYNQIMFVNYMPFLCMGFFGVDRYFSRRAVSWNFSGTGQQMFRKKYVCLTKERRTGRKNRNENSDSAVRMAKKKGNVRTFFWARSSGLLIVSVFLMIMTSFYFSIGGMLVLGVYAIHRYLMECGRMRRQVTAAGLLKEGAAFILRLLIAVMMSSILLVPTIFALTGRENSVTGISWQELLIPQFRIKEFCYNPYSLGLTTLAFTILVSVLFFKKWQDKILAGSCLFILCIPLFSWLLNGGLYMRDKALIPFLPLLCYLIALYLHSLENGPKTGRMTTSETGRRFISSILPYVLTSALIITEKNKIGASWCFWLLLADAVLMAVFFCIFWRKRNALFLLAPSILFLAFFGVVCHQSMDRMLDKDFYKAVNDREIGRLLSETLAKETGFYRAEQSGTDKENEADINRIWTNDQYISSLYSSGYHQGYDTFRKKTFQLEQPFRNCLMQSSSRNPVFERFMGVKYICSKETVPGAAKTAEKGGWKIYENPSASPVIYSTDRMISASEYAKLKFPYNQLALLYYAVDDDKTSSAENVKEEICRDSGVQDISGDFAAGISGTGWISETAGGFAVCAEAEEEISVALPTERSVSENPQQKVLFLQFQVKNLHPDQDLSIWVGEMKNTLTAKSHYYYNENTTFTFAVPLEEGQRSAKLTFGKGTYQLSGIRAFLAKLPEQRVGDPDGLYQSQIRLNTDKTRGNVISGQMTVTKAGDLVTTIPYEKNFTIYVDGKQTAAKDVNTAFLGCSVGEGRHEITIIYHAPGVTAGKVLSLMGLVWFVLLLRTGRRKSIRARQKTAI